VPANLVALNAKNEINKMNEKKSRNHNQVSLQPWIKQLVAVLPKGERLGFRFFLVTMVKSSGSKHFSRKSSQRNGERTGVPQPL
jgi:hypothetical protein